jgi:hypothetical protein
MIAPIARRRWFPYRLPLLLAAVALLAVPCTWFAVRTQQAKRQREAAAAIRKLGGNVEWSNPSGPAWLRSLLGDDYFEHVEDVDLEGTRVTDAGLETLKELNQLVTLALGNTKITDAALENLEGLNRLEALDLSATKVSDAGLERLKGMRKLQDLTLWGSQVTDAGLEHLKGLDQLQTLDLRFTEVTDAGLEHLQGLSQLRELRLYGTRVTDAGEKKLRQALPCCGVNRLWLPADDWDQRHLKQRLPYVLTVH